MHVCMVNVPWARVDAPSIQCGLLKSVVIESGFSCDVKYCNVDFAQEIGAELYGAIASTYAGDLFGEWLFSYSAFGEVLSESEYLTDYPEIEGLWRGASHGTRGSLRQFRRELILRWLDDYVSNENWSEYDVVGISSTCLQQSAALALGRRLKSAYPDVTLVYGGANFDGAMGVEFVKSIPWIDFAISGEAERSFPNLLHELAKSRKDRAPSPRSRLIGSNAMGLIEDMDESPQPDYSDYFEHISHPQAAGLVVAEDVRLPVELSRGCWWGERHQCTFCGLNGLSLGYRAKSPRRALNEVESLLKTYETPYLDMVDNVLSMGYLGEFCETLANREWDINIFAEVKANLTKAQLAKLHRAGINSVQPGIESLSTHVLGLMNKGSTKLINLRVLKWARYYGMSVAWTILHGFPGECDEDYYEQARTAVNIVHLEPPFGCRRFLLERFSPMHDDPPKALSDIRPSRSYGHVYPQWINHGEIAYTFDYVIDDCASVEALAKLEEAVDGWKAGWSSGVLPQFLHRRFPNRVVLFDSRGGRGRRITLRGWRASAYLACDETFHNVEKVRQLIAKDGFEVELDELNRFLTTCLRESLMEYDKGYYLALSLPEHP